ncbi:MBL fold metallo-hydrolase [Conexibacter sp. JD483]|uniref:MBL fold metallo-hydrolase n=1 Tax=unclassified Conexibacter TaxID=2627773 RepID=UPI002715937A|nr:MULTISPECIES: MBL fold metallo-hydrolase [unclassified Conexibacter]MDO8184754.1 MBL fold metallo-hydrolase [Conexibacter sp. CPCC 205706]MDO8196529.1 MBL fold metallo-hydrolase [Conexibacter sp. CPCC 205762]MDR9369015.1 MBL fold metallo-hydrolase [Conexibacter sp. JD483]
MRFYEITTPDGWGIPGIHGNWAEDELDGNVQGAVFLIRSGDEALLIDSGNRVPGSDVSMGPTIVEKLERDGVTLKYLLISHFHYDHTGNAAEIKQRFGPEVLAHALDRPVIEDPLILASPENALRFGVTPEQLLADFNLAPGESLGLSDPAVIDRYWNFPVAVDREVADGDVLHVGELELQVVHLPGHAPGQVGIWNPATRSLYCADIVHYPSPLSPYPIGNAADQIATLEKCLAFGAEYLWEGHYLGAYDAPAVKRRLEHLLRAQHDTADRLLTLLGRGEGPQTILELLPEVFPIKTDLNYEVSSGPGHRWAYAEACIQTHLQRLVELGRVQRVSAAGVVRFALV